MVVVIVAVDVFVAIDVSVVVDIFVAVDVSVVVDVFVVSGGLLVIFGSNAVVENCEVFGTIIRYFNIRDRVTANIVRIRKDAMRILTHRRCHHLPASIDLRAGSVYNWL